MELTASSPPENAGSAETLDGWNIFCDLSADIRKRYFSEQNRPHPSEDKTELLCSFALEMMKSEPPVASPGHAFDQNNSAETTEMVEEFIFMELRLLSVYEVYKKHFPTSIWHCCLQRCFITIAADPEQTLYFAELLQIHSLAEKLHQEVRMLPQLVPRRRRGVGGSNVVGYYESRAQREGDMGTDLQLALRTFGKFVIQVLPFLYGQGNAPSGTPNIVPKKMCTRAIRDLLGISLKFLYQRKDNRVSLNSEVSDVELCSLVDFAGVRLRQHRRTGSRAGYPSVDELNAYDCGCMEPCLSETSSQYLENEYAQFSKIAKNLNPRRKENRFLLDRLYCPLSNTTVKTCDNALAALYCTSRGHIRDVRLALEAMLQNPGTFHENFEAGVRGYVSNGRHVREKIETHLDMVLRADPSGSRGLNVFRVYSSEINTREKLRNSIAEALDADDTLEAHLSESTLDRMLTNYLKSRNSRISFDQNDHNACHNCKTLRYAVLQYHYDAKKAAFSLRKAFKGHG